jgi:hypothetical protein
MKKIIAFFGIACTVVYLTAAGYAYAAGSGARTQTGAKQLVVDGDMENATTTAWTPFGAGAVLTKEYGGVTGKRVLRVTDLTTTGAGYQANLFVMGKTYRVTGWARSDGAGSSPTIGDGYMFVNIWTGGTANNAWQRVDAVFTPVNNAFVLTKYGAGGAYTEWDDIVVTEVTGSNKTVIGGKNVLVDGDMEKSDTSIWGNTLCTTAAKVPGGAVSGKYVLHMEREAADWWCSNWQNVLTVGKAYKFEGWYRGGLGGYPSIFYCGIQPESATWRKFSCTGTAVGTLFAIYKYGPSAPGGAWVEFDDLTITEYNGQTVSGGKQLLLDGDMEKPTTSDWTVYNGATLSKVPGSAVSGKRIIRIAKEGLIGAAYQTILTVGKRYRITGYGRGDGAGVAIPAVLIGGYLWTGTNSTAWQKFSFTVVAGGTIFYLEDRTSSGFTEFDDVVVTEI